LLGGKRSNSPQLFTGALGPPSGGIARRGKNPAANEYPAAKEASECPDVPTLGEICRNFFMQNELKLKSFVNHIISLSPAAPPLVLVLRAAFI
jgi:hypothetical protein